MIATPCRARLPLSLAMALVLALTLLAVTGAGRPAAAFAASHPVRSVSSVRPVRSVPSGSIVADDSTTTAPLSSPSGLTTVWLPSQVRTGRPLVVLAHTTPRAVVRLTITFADGTAIVRQGRAGAAGFVRFTPSITYQPLSSAEAATVVVTAVLRRTGLNDTVSGSVTVFPYIKLVGRIKAPFALTIGRTLTITVVSNQPNVFVRVTLTYPDGQKEFPNGSTDATDTLPLSIPVSPLHGVGPLRIEAVLSYGGVERRLTPVTVHLRAPRAHG